MKSAAYYSRKAENCRELGRWTAADEWTALAVKARRVAKRKRDRADRRPVAAREE